MTNIEELKLYIYPNGKYSSKRSNSINIKKHFPEIYENIKDNYHTKLYMLLHDINEIPNCKNPNCNNKVKLKNIGKGFHIFCSTKCINEFQKTDKLFSDKISKSLLSKNILSNKYKDIKVSREKNNKNYIIIKDYCKHGNIKLYTKVFNSLYNNNLSLCENCNKEFIENYIPSNDEINNLHYNFEDFYKKIRYVLNDKHMILFFPKEYNIILNWSKHIKNISLAERVYLFRYNLIEPPKCANCNNSTYFNNSQLKYTTFCHSKSCINNTSNGEIELFNFIKSLDSNTIHKYFITRREYDIKINNILIEYNGLYWHSDAIQEDKNYHLNKLKLANDNRYSLLTIWEDDWEIKKDIIKSMICSRLNKTTNKIYARKCEIREVKDVKDFLNENHLQGWCQSSIRLGLYYHDNLVSLMTFGKRNIHKNKKIELLRFCNILNTNVIGGASKLFSYFLKNYEYDSIITYANCDYSNGNLYEKLKFKKIKHTGLNFWWVKDKIKYNRSTFMKYKIDDKSGLTAKEQMENKGYNIIWGNGNYLYEYNK
jgi:hypothetical protein